METARPDCFAVATPYRYKRARTCTSGLERRHRCRVLALARAISGTLGRRVRRHGGSSVGVVPIPEGMVRDPGGVVGDGAGVVDVDGSVVAVSDGVEAVPDSVVCDLDGAVASPDSMDADRDPMVGVKCVTVCHLAPVGAVPDDLVSVAVGMASVALAPVADPAAMVRAAGELVGGVAPMVRFRSRLVGIALATVADPGGEVARPGGLVCAPISVVCVASATVATAVASASMAFTVVADGVSDVRDPGSSVHFSTKVSPPARTTASHAVATDAPPASSRRTSEAAAPFVGPPAAQLSSFVLTQVETAG